jgi:LuxR family maltose regulon positive regulatory protein
MADQTTPIPLIRTKLHRPPVTRDLLCREKLHERLDASRHLPLTLVSAPAGYGKSTLIGHWLETSDIRGAWLSLDEGDNYLRLSPMYLTAAVQTLFPEACKNTVDLLKSG